MKQLVWVLSAALAVALDAAREDAVFYLALCTSGSWLDTALSAFDWRHVAAFPWSNAFMLLFCLMGHGALSRAWPRQLTLRLLTMVSAMPLACLAGGMLTARLPVEWPPSMQVATWCATMLATCAGLMHVLHARPLHALMLRRIAARFSPIL